MMRQRRSGRADLPAAAYDRIPRVALTLTGETIWLTRFDARGHPTATYPVEAADVASAFRAFGANTGLLAPDTLFWQNVRGAPRIGVWLAPSVRELAFTSGRGVERIKVPLPGFVFVGHGSRYWIHACMERPRDTMRRLYLAPLPNVHANGEVCPGSVKFPLCAAQTIHAAAELFFSSHFNDDLSERKVTRALWPARAVRPRYRGDDIRNMVDDGDDDGDADPREPKLLACLRTLQGRSTFPEAGLRTSGMTLDQVLKPE